MFYLWYCIIVACSSTFFKYHSRQNVVEAAQALHWNFACVMKAFVFVCVGESCVFSALLRQYCGSPIGHHYSRVIQCQLSQPRGSPKNYFNQIISENYTYIGIGSKIFSQDILRSKIFLRPWPPFEIHETVKNKVWKNIFSKLTVLHLLSILAFLHL